MSIPPLVCSTPPPPDQCEDDKEHEEFGFQYNLSQEEVDEFDYGNFSKYNEYQASKPEDAPSPAKILFENKEITPDTPSHEIDGLETHNIPSYEFKEIPTSKTKLKIDDELNIEDLNLEIGKEEKIQETEINETIVTKVDNVVDSLTDIPPEEGSKETPIVETKESPTPFEKYIVQSTILNNNNEPKPFIDDKIETGDLEIENDPVVIEIQKNGDDFKPTDQLEDRSISLEVKFNDDEIQSTENESNKFNECVPTVMLPTEIKETIKTEEDDFGDFEDFQISSNVSNVVVTAIDSGENPWENEEIVDNDFGDFKANFNEENDLFKVEPKVEDLHSKEDSNIQSDYVDDDDDFGDFDGFQSSSVANVQEEPQLLVPVLNLQSSDSESQIIEKIDLVVSSLFEDNLEEIEEELSMKLESCLGVTWGHLLETDVRQPYIVQWNNSSAQQLLLKALCIDSRNILFGPKWSYNMPKYATNLSVAPLQPQKQTVSFSVTTETSKEKSSSKSGTWSDPFTSDSQESNNPETVNETATHQIGPTDLDVFEASSSSKPDKIYPTTMNIQPIRQISLPDTHIFTPTNSETPRSKTIHYDNNQPIHLPQSSIDSIKSIPDNPSVQKVSSKNLNDDDYWEFQDFKGAPSNANEPIPSTSKQTFEKTEHSKPNSITYATQVLQPVKVEPITPTLNWPAPGEVKETFDDFSDFISSTSWSDKQETTNITNPSHVDIEQSKSGINAISKSEVTASDDEFDTFQSALPSDNEPSTFNTNQPLKTIPTLSISQTTMSSLVPQNSFENDLPKIEPTLPNLTTSLPSKVKNNLTSLSPAFVPTNTENISMNKVLTNTVLPTPSSSNLGLTLLQPIQANSARNNQSKSTQILQPLSLESYSQINWPNPGIDLQDLSRFNPVNTLQNLKSDLSAHSTGSPVHAQKGVSSQSSDDDWGEFVSGRPKTQQLPPKKSPVPLDDDEWTDFISSPVVKPQNGLSTISLNVHTNLTSQKANPKKVALKTPVPLEIPTLNYVTPKSSQKTYKDRHFQNL